MLVNSDTGEISAPIAGFWEAEEVDSSRFIKLFVNGVKALAELTNPGTRVFELLYIEMQNQIGKDQVYLSYTGLDKNEKKTLRGLTIPNSMINPRRSVFRDWIDDLSDSNLLHTTIIYSNEEIIGWAAANMGDDWNCGTIGAFIQYGHRKRGHAKRALEILLPKLKELYPKAPEYLFYMVGEQGLFAPIVEQSGFKDRVKLIDEYRERYKKANSEEYYSKY